MVQVVKVPGWSQGAGWGSKSTCIGALNQALGAHWCTLLGAPGTVLGLSIKYMDTLGCPQHPQQWCIKDLERLLHIH